MNPVLTAKLQEVARALQELVDQENGGLSNLEAWYDLAHVLEKFIRSDLELTNVMPELVWHFLADADVRMKSPEYSKSQLQRLSQVLSFLRRGELPR